MASATWLVTGTSRGLGLELVRQLARSPTNRVIAACRNSDRATALHSLTSGAKGDLHVLELDVGDPASIRDSVKTVEHILGDSGLDYLYNNAGVNAKIDDAFGLDCGDFMKALEINVAAPALLAQAYLPLIEKSQRKVIVNVSSRYGSVSLDRGPTWPVYSITKSALNMLTYKQAKARPDLIVISLAPGWVKTGEHMGGPNAALEPHQSVEDQLRIVTGLTPQDSGKFFNHTGEVYPY
ncbi:hypothetical protein IEO21_05219 [Rhodonia placenta]|uniref:NAD(P)-binding protein n=1 Tax=Rhodonia placenta TaxID=104341 RepID=A0A8H7P2U8_9APHY|nr:hypothetical protein IEO21_05219 [Postia placenta]